MPFAILRQPVDAPHPDVGTHICVLLAACNGERFLAQQLESLAAQSFENWSLLASVDHSTDATRAILDRFAARMRQQGRAVRIIDGPGQGAASNFLHLVRHAPDDCRLAFCDQDDVWLPHKLARASAWLDCRLDERPVLYCARTWVVNERLRAVGFSRDKSRVVSFANALCESVPAGNTIVLNMAASTLLRQASAEAHRAASHDWWAYQLVTGAGGQVLYDPTPALLYRQHDKNVLGASAGFVAVLRRLRLVATGTLRRWNLMNLKALSASAHRLTGGNRRLLYEVLAARKAGGRLRLVYTLWNRGIRRNDRKSSVAIMIFALCGLY